MLDYVIEGPSPLANDVGIRSVAFHEDGRGGA